MGGDALLWLAIAGSVLAVAVLRFAWAQRRRSALLNSSGWGLLVAASVCAGMAAGAWGVSVAALFAMGAATAALAVAVATSPQGRAAASNRRVKMLPESGEPRRIGRRVATFLLVFVAGFLASVAFVIGLQSGAVALGWGEANANAIALFAVPVVWGVLACVMLMQARRRSQFAALAICALPIVPALLSGA